MRLTMVTRYYGLPIHHYKMQLLDLVISNCALTIIYYYNIIGNLAGTSLIQHICAILAFESGSYATVPQTHREFKLEYSYKFKSQAVF